MCKLLLSLLALSFSTFTFADNLETTAADVGGNSSHCEESCAEPYDVPQGPQKPLYDIEPSPVHQWIALQAYLKLPGSDLKAELANYLPTDVNSSYYRGDYQETGFVSPAGWWENEDAPYQQSTALIEGSWEEDKGEFIPGTELPLRSVVHFWNPDGDYNAGLDLSFLGSGIQPSALEAAQDRFRQAVTHYGMGEKTWAYYWLGRTAHLLMDLSVPAHVQLDPHIAFLNDADNYETFTANRELHYKHITWSSPLTTPPSPPFTQYPRYTPSWFDNDLTNLFYSLANVTDQFDSDDENGDSDAYGKGKYRRASNAIRADKTFDSACKINLIGQEIRSLTSPADYFVVDCPWSQDASIIYSAAFHSEINNLLYGVRVYYTDTTSEDFYSPDEDNVPWAVCGEIFQPQLQSQGIGYVAALYQLFWRTTHPSADDNYEENDDADHAFDLSGHWATWLHDADGFGVLADDDWYEIFVPVGIECLYIECRFAQWEGDVDMRLLDDSEDVVAESNNPSGDVERICYEAPAQGNYFIRVYQQSYSGNAYDLWWGSDCTDKIVLSSPPDGSRFFGCDPEIVVKWNLSDKATKYEVEIDDNPQFSSPCYLAWTTTERDSAEVCAECGNLSPGQYYWHVRGQTGSPCDLWGEWGDSWSFEVTCPELTIDPGSVTPANGSRGPRLVEFEWAATLGAARYKFQIDTVSAEFDHLWCNEVIPENHTTKTIPVLVDEIYWRVKALGSGYCEDGTWTSPNVYTCVREADYALSQNHPNPFNQATRIEFTLAKSGFVSLSIYDVRGRKVRTLVSENLSSGHRSILWDGRNDSGINVASGVYFYQLRAGEFCETKKLVMLK